MTLTGSRLRAEGEQREAEPERDRVKTRQSDGERWTFENRTTTKAWDTLYLILRSRISEVSAARVRRRVTANAPLRHTRHRGRCDVCLRAALDGQGTRISPHSSALRVSIFTHVARDSPGNARKPPARRQDSALRSSRVTRSPRITPRAAESRVPRARPTAWSSCSSRCHPSAGRTTRA